MEDKKVTRNMSKNRSRERRTRPDKNDPLIITISITQKDRERLDEILRSRRYRCEDIFRVGLDDLSA